MNRSRLWRNKYILKPNLVSNYTGDIEVFERINNIRTYVNDFLFKEKTFFPRLQQDFFSFYVTVQGQVVEWGYI